MDAEQLAERNNTSGTKIKHESSEDSSNESIDESNISGTQAITQEQTVEQAQNFILNILNGPQSDAPHIDTSISTENLQLPKYDIAFQQTPSTKDVDTHMNTMKADKTGTCKMKRKMD